MNVAAPIIAILNHSEIDTEVSDVSMETAEFNDCREMLGDDGDANDMLAMTQEEARFFCKDGQKFINLFIQSISELCWMSQLYPRIKEQEESSRVTQKYRFIQSPVGKIMGKLAILKIMLFDKPLNKQKATSRVVNIFKQ